VDLGSATGFAVVFAVIGGLELFDRTSFALIALATRAHALGTWAGGAVAFVLTTVIAVVAGTVLTEVLGPSRIGLLRVAGGAFLLGYAAWLFYRLEEPEKESEFRHTARTSFATAFVTIFLLELGDTTQVFEIVFVANWGTWVVLIAGSLALVVVAAWDVALGRRIGTRVEPRLLRKIVIVVLVIVGVVTIAFGLAPSALAPLAVARPLGLGAGG